MKITTALWKYKPLKDGTYPLKIKVFQVIDGKKQERYHHLDIYLREDQWDKKSGRVKNHPNAVDYNVKLLELQRNLEAQKSKSESINIPKARTGESFIKYYRNYLETIIKKKHSAHHYNKNNSILVKLENYAPNLRFKDITREFVNKYDVHLIGLGNQPVTRHDNFKRIKYIFDEAIEEKIVSIDDSPFERFKVVVPRKKKKRLTYAEIVEIENSYFKENSNQWHTRNWWLFSFYCAGIRFGDMCRLTRKNISGDHLIYTMNKSLKTPNPQDRIIKMMPPAMEILNIYLKRKHKYIFGIIDKLPKDKFEAAKLINDKNSLANNNLKKIAKAIKSDVELSFHTSRHSFSDYCKKKKFDVHLIKDLLGHSKVSTTEDYMLDFYEEETDEAMNTLFGKKD